MNNVGNAKLPEVGVGLSRMRSRRRCVMRKMSNGGKQVRATHLSAANENDRLAGDICHGKCRSDLNKSEKDTVSTAPLSS